MPFNKANTAKTITYAQSPYRVSPNDDMLDIDTTDGAVSIVIPAMKEYVKHWFYMQLTPSAAHAATVTLDNGGNINAASSYSLSVVGQSALFMSQPDGTYETLDAGLLSVVTALSSGQLIVGSSGGVPIARTVTGDVLISPTGVTSIPAGIVTRNQLSAPAARTSRQVTGGTIATTSNTDEYAVVQEAGSLASVEITPLVALTADNTNYLTWTITNLGQAGGGSTAMLAVSNANTTKSTGGTGLAINTNHPLTVHGTAANLVVASGDLLLIRAAATGTLANTVTRPIYQLRFTGTT